MGLHIPSPSFQQGIPRHRYSPAGLLDMDSQGQGGTQQKGQLSLQRRHKAATDYHGSCDRLEPNSSIRFMTAKQIGWYGLLTHPPPWMWRAVPLDF